MSIFDIVHNTLTEYRRHTAVEQTRAVIGSLENAGYLSRSINYDEGGSPQPWPDWQPTRPGVPPVTPGTGEQP